MLPKQFIRPRNLRSSRESGRFALTEINKGNNNKDVFTLLLVTRGRLNATTTNATAMAAMTTMTKTTTITTSNANVNTTTTYKDGTAEVNAG